MRPIPFRHLAPVLILTSLAVACTQTPRPSPPVVTPTPAPQATVVIHSAKTGRTYTAVQLPEKEAAEEPMAPATALGAPSSDNFRGTDRAGAKTSVVDGDPQTFDDVTALASSGLLVADDQMLNHNPAIARDSDDRVDEEDHNVVVTGFLYASKKESDNDFHCIIGTSPDDQTPAFLNVEVSGLPNGQFRQQLKGVRDAFKTFFADQLPGTGYSKFNPPIPVRITGSLFYDIDHKPGEVGPAAFKPTTAWEIHPVSAIEFEPGQ